MRSSILVVLLIATLLLIALASQITKRGEELDLESAYIKVVGQSFIGLQYTKEITLYRTDSGFHLIYRCKAKKGFEGLCKHRQVEKQVETDRVKEFLEKVQSLEDEGERAKCCDHSWTEIELTYVNGTVRKLTVAFEPLKVEEIFGIFKSSENH